MRLRPSAYPLRSTGVPPAGILEYPRRGTGVLRRGYNDQTPRVSVRWVAMGGYDALSDSRIPRARAGEREGQKLYFTPAESVI